MTTWSEVLLLVHAAATWFMTGLIWFVQIVHYPLMAGVGPDAWRAYEREHQRRTTFVVAPVMLIELSLAAALAASPTIWPILFSHSVPAPVSPSLAWGGLALLGLAWISTFALQVPAHRGLETSFTTSLHSRLVTTNWVRTVAWSARGVFALCMLRTA